MRWRTIALLAVLGCSACRTQMIEKPAPPPTGDIRFVDITAAAGIDFVHRHGGIGKKYFIETSGAGACFFDYDNDGDPDLFLVQSGVLPGQPGFGGSGNVSRLYENQGDGTFVEVTETAGVANNGYGQGCCAADYDGDGDLDLLVTNFGPNRLYRNNGDGTFTDVAEQAGVACPGYNTSAAFADFDGDGDLDLYLARYSEYSLATDPGCSSAAGKRAYCPPAQFEGQQDLLLENKGNGAFVDITAAAGFHDPDGKGLGVVCFDYNQDGRPDIYVANDGTTNRLYENLGGNRFRDITAVAGVGLQENGSMGAGMGVDAGDYDGDGRFDLFVANFSTEANALYRNRGDGSFEFKSPSVGLAQPSMIFSGFGAAFFDYDLDGLRDVIVANGHVDDLIDEVSPASTYAEPNSLYRNLGTGGFEDVSASVGPDFRLATVSRGLALADIDADGDLDFLISNNNGRPNLFRNDGGNRNGWIQLALLATRGEPFAIGARVEVVAGGQRQVREVRTGSSYCSQHQLVLTVGLGPGVTRVEKISVRWPGRQTQEWRDLPAGQRHELRERPGP